MVEVDLEIYNGNKDNYQSASVTFKSGIDKIVKRIFLHENYISHHTCLPYHLTFLKLSLVI